MIIRISPGDNTNCEFLESLVTTFLTSIAHHSSNTVGMVFSKMTRYLQKRYLTADKKSLNATAYPINTLSIISKLLNLGDSPVVESM